jgi:hypothetical protein
MQPEPVAFERSKAQHVDHGKVIRQHRDQEPSPTVGGASTTPIFLQFVPPRQYPFADKTRRQRRQLARDDLAV